MKHTRTRQMSTTSFSTKWYPDRCRQAYELALLGHTDAEIATVFDIAVATIDRWKQTHSRFLESLNEGKVIADARVAQALYKRAVGFTKKEMHVCQHQGRVIQTPVEKYYPPDSWAANKWLSMRQRTKWADSQKIDITRTNININKFDFTGISDTELRLLEKIGISQQQKQLAEHVNPNSN